MSALVGPFSKDCGCRDHAGPHWLHMDAADRRRTHDLVERLRESRDRDHAAALAHTIATYEVQRLREKRRNMERAGITCIPAAVTTEIEAFGEMARAARMKRWRRERRGEIAVLKRRLASLAAEHDSPDPTAARKEAIRTEVDKAQARIASLTEELASAGDAGAEREGA